MKKREERVWVQEGNYGARDFLNLWGTYASFSAYAHKHLKVRASDYQVGKLSWQE